MTSSAAYPPLDIEVLYDSHISWLRDWLRRQTRCSHRAEDLAQDTFSKVIERQPTGPLRDPRAFLATIARCLLIDDARRSRVERAFLEAHEAIMAGACAPDAEQIVAAIEELRIVMAALEEMPERARSAFLLARVDGLGHAEIAARLGVSKSMVKQYVAKAYACCYAAAYGAAG